MLPLKTLGHMNMWFICSVQSLVRSRGRNPEFFSVAGEVNLRHMRLRLEAVTKMKRSEVSIELKFNIRQCCEATPWEVNSTSIILTEMVSLLHVPDLENCGLFWAPCFKNDSYKPEWIKEEDSKKTQVGIISDEAQGKDPQCHQVWETWLQVCEQQPRGRAYVKYSSNFMRTNLEPTGGSYWLGVRHFPNPWGHPTSAWLLCEQEVWMRSSRSRSWRGICQGPWGREGSPAWARGFPGLFLQSPSFFLLLVILLL